MIDPTHQPFDESGTARRLTADLSAIYARSIPIPTSVDEAILKEAHHRASRVRQMRLFFRWGGGLAAAAAILLVTLRLIPSEPPKFNPQSRVTILDAFSLARQLKANSKPDKSWDVNGDGQIDQKDVDALAVRAVALPKGGVQ